ncbi:CoA-transferase family III domain-containing protein, partial [Hyaloraphidium curvatum]
LSHLRVVDCATFIAGPSTSTLLADFGASVVRIEPPWGDPWRGAAFGISGAYPYDTTNRNKRCISLDLKRPEAREVLRRLVKGADVFVTNALPSSRERMGIDYASLSALNPRLIYASVSAYGERGPEADAPGFDPQAYWARSGMLSILRTSPIPGTGDHPTAVSLVAGVLLALYNRERTGKGSHVSTAL